MCVCMCVSVCLSVYVFVCVCVCVCGGKAQESIYQIVDTSSDMNKQRKGTIHNMCILGVISVFLWCIYLQYTGFSLR